LLATFAFKTDEFPADDFLTFTNSLGETREPGNAFEIVLPDAHDGIALAPQFPPRAVISAPVGHDLFRPEFHAGFRDASALWAGVPKAPIDKHGESDPGEIKVGSSWDSSRMLSPADDSVLPEGGLHSDLS